MVKMSPFVRKMKDYKMCMKVLDCANFVFLEEIETFDFKKISKYNKSRHLYDKVFNDFKLINEIINKKDVLNSATLLRSLYENILYIIVMSYKPKTIINLNTTPRELRKIVEKNHKEIFSEYFEEEDFNAIYSYLCKLVHPCSLKEIVSYMEKTVKYRKYIIFNLKFTMLVIEYMYLNFLNKKAGNEESQLDLDFIDLCTYANLVNINYYIYDIKGNQNFINRYFYYDTNNKYIVDNQIKLEELYKMLSDNDTDKKIEKDVTEIANRIDKELSNSKYINTINEILVK